ncbi:hypothetical protein PGT21_013310 [Puccinia graminis f. sp. tritici]|uniref:Uncharacterized protein n=1 Tax=Puccinia graminis f. sp. tritici TaxID=56615 RepID=A0A5B0NJH5_PUCGR|nr:hypothetical protein PGTUg99_034990 [Puccinia graminis f. sp. tritici]KAA1101252.1 hypothetical protein PGT21_013310 [Puccinia graminis f. sp. tritici]
MRLGKAPVAQGQHRLIYFDLLEKICNFDFLEDPPQLNDYDISSTSFLPWQKKRVIELKAVNLHEGTEPLERTSTRILGWFTCCDSQNLDVLHRLACLIL